MFIDKKGKLFGKISIVDVIIVILVIAVTMGLVLKFNKSNTTVPFVRTDTIYLTFYSPSVHSDIIDLIKIGDTVTDRKTNAVFGKVVGITKGDSVIYTHNSEGKCVASVKPNYYSIRVEVKGNGKYSDAGAYLHNKEYYAGKSFTTLGMSGVSFSAKIYDIKKR